MELKKLILTACCFCFFGFSVLAQAVKKVPALNEKLFIELSAKDSLLFDIAFKSCDLKQLESIFAPGFVFYHDRGYSVATSPQSLDDFKKNIKRSCENKSRERASMRREIVKGSLQVFEQGETRAIQTGVQRFYRTENGKAEKIVEESKFSRTWNKIKGNWLMVSELDYMVNTHPVSLLGELRYEPKPYAPESVELYQKIVSLDSAFFGAYNNCELDKMAAMMSDELEFYHDRGGLSTSKKQVLESIQKNICGKVTRILAKGSIEVYPIKDFGVVQIGYHSFRNIAEPGESEPSKFITLWRLKDGNWQATRIVSLH
ncbi:nuclear transport factor 2 family protein [Pedobacter nutrimenti]|jgi:hypothetical protein|uniref:Uncharacterized protein DUF4440 n=1 Tax=Pedobacter nutrimenti TaxID=1241337 RepID=A0A318UHE7_9SPHI|nr:nuclear transport factor 2 family protein [Pedobacter nutrimenti]PYF74448.1 uncharacterized protein DUF4440 [Pedobacter nutrimenti]